MSTRGQRAVRDRLAELLAALAQDLVAKGSVTAVGTNTVTVLRPGDTADQAQAFPRLRSYSDPKVGDVVLLVGPPGAWVALGAQA